MVELDESLDDGQRHLMPYSKVHERDQRTHDLGLAFSPCELAMAKRWILDGSLLRKNFFVMGRHRMLRR